MKKVFYSIALMMVAVFSSVLLTGCGDPEPQSLKIKTDSVQTSVLVNESFNTDGLKVIVTYDDGATETVSKNNDMEISSIDTSKVGSQTLTVKYLGLTATLTIKVYATENDKLQIAGFELPEHYVTHLGNKNNAGGDIKVAANDIRFAKGDSIYKVGDDNAFKFLPKVMVIDPENPLNSYAIEQYSSVVTIKERAKNEANFTELTGAALTEKVVVDTLNSTYDFTPAAVGKIYQITVHPAQMTAASSYTAKTIEVEVVNGWNAYDEADLSRINSSADYWNVEEDFAGSSDDVWADFKAGNNEYNRVITNDPIESIVLHRDMHIGLNDIPASFVYGSNAGDSAGTLKDRKSIYTRYIPVGSTFTIYGNYFGINTINEGANAIPLVLQQNFGDGQFGHSALFSFGGDNHNEPYYAHNQGKVVLQDLSLKGNGPKANDQEKYAGGLTAINSTAGETLIDNCLFRSFTTQLNISGNTHGVTFNHVCTVKNSKLSDSYGSMFFAWGSKENNIINSVLKDAGGPLIVATHVTPDEGDNIAYADCYADVNVDNSVLSNPVGGTEAWFMTTGAALVMPTFSAHSTLMSLASEDLINAGVDTINAVSAITNMNSGKGEFNFMLCNMGEDSLGNTQPIMNNLSVKDAAGNTIVAQSMFDMNVLTIFAMLTGDTNGDGQPDTTPEYMPGMTFPPIYQAGGVYVTLDINAGVDGSSDGLGLYIDPTNFGGEHSEGGTIAQKIMSNTGSAFLSLDGFIGESWYEADAEVKAAIDAALGKFFNANYVNLYFNGPLLGCSFEMFHEA